MEPALINTDGSDYLSEFVGDGFPPSTVRTREFIHRPTYYRDEVLQFPPTHTRAMINDKQTTELIEGTDLYHRSLLTAEQEAVVVRRILPFLPAGWPKFVDDVDLLTVMMHVPCDLVVCRRQADGKHRLDLVHLFFPNGWGAEEAVGREFNYFHDEVRLPSNKKRVVPSTPKFVDHLIDSGRTYERVGAFSIKTASDFNKHPSKPYKTVFENNEPMFVRFERQVIVGVPEAGLFLFFIHTNIVDFRARPRVIYNAVDRAHPDCYVGDKLAEYRDYYLRYLERYLED